MAIAPTIEETPRRALFSIPEMVGALGRGLGSANTSAPGQRRVVKCG